MNTQKCVTTSMQNINYQVISFRKCTEPTVKAKEIYDLMGYKTIPFYRKKTVVVPRTIRTIKTSHIANGGNYPSRTEIPQFFTTFVFI